MYKKKILVVCPHPVNTAPGQRLKYEQYFNTWENAGYEITVTPFMSPDFWNIVYKKGNFFKKIIYTFQGYKKRITDIMHLKKYDVVYIFLWVTPFGWPLFEYLFYKRNKNIIYDIDDLVYLGHSSKANRFFKIIKGQKKMPYLMAKAKHVIVCTPMLEAYARKFNSLVSDISSTINTDIYVPVNTYTQSNPIVLGWSGSHSTAPYLKLLAPVLLRLAKVRNFKLIVMGDANFNIDGLQQIQALDWSEEIELKTLQSFDIGLYPLPDEPWVHGKSGLKALQYMALGIPAIATAIGANYRIIEHGISGILVHNEDEWFYQLCKLIDNAAYRKQIGLAGRARVEAYYSVNANMSKYLNILNPISNG